MTKLRQKLIIVLVVFAFTGGTFFMYLALRGNAPESLHATVLPEPMPLPEFSLLDQEGKPFDRSSFTGHWSVVFFGFTNCPDICPATLMQLSVARTTALANDKTGKYVFPDIVFISVDPDRDTTDLVADYISIFGPGVTGVTGELDELTRLTRATGIYFQKPEQAGDTYSVDHSAAVLLINPDGNFHAVFGAPHNIDSFVHDLPIITERT